MGYISLCAVGNVSLGYISLCVWKKYKEDPKTNDVAPEKASSDSVHMRYKPRKLVPAGYELTTPEAEEMFH